MVGGVNLLSNWNEFSVKFILKRKYEEVDACIAFSCLQVMEL